MHPQTIRMGGPRKGLPAITIAAPRQGAPETGSETALNHETGMVNLVSWKESRMLCSGDTRIAA